MELGLTRPRLPHQVLCLVSLVRYSEGDVREAYLPSALFRALPCLRQLYLFDGQLTALDPALFARLPQLEYLGLARNRLTALDPDLFRGSSRLVRLELDGNQLACPPRSSPVSIASAPCI